MENKVFIHVGFPKTASTYLQKSVFSRIPGFQYISPEITQNTIGWNHLQYADDLDFDAKSFRENLGELSENNRPLLISDELFVGKPWFNGMGRTQICKRLAENFPNAKILMIVRGQYEMCKSLHNQWIKGARRGSKTFGSFFRIYADAGNKVQKSGLTYNTDEDFLHPEYLNYYKIIRLYKSHFTDIKIIPYELLMTDPKGFIREIGGYLNTPIDQPVEKTERVNTSLKGRHLATQMVVNSFKNMPLTKLERKLLSLKYSRTLQRQNDREYLESKDLIQKYYSKTNLKITEEYPEIGIQHYPEAYRIALNT